MDQILNALVQQSPTIGFMAIMIFYGAKRLDAIVDRCMDSQDKLIDRFMERLDSSD